MCVCVCIYIYIYIYKYIIYIIHDIYYYITLYDPKKENKKLDPSIFEE